MTPSKSASNKHRIVYGKPTCIHRYNKSCEGVDHCNHNTIRYRYHHRLTKWWKCVLYHLIQLTISNSWVLYKECYKHLNVDGKIKRYKFYPKYYEDIILDWIDFKIFLIKIII